MQYFNVYERKGADILSRITTVQAPTIQLALVQWTEKFGDNYGAVVITPVLPSVSIALSA